MLLTPKSIELAANVFLLAADGKINFIDHKYFCEWLGIYPQALPSQRYLTQKLIEYLTNYIDPKDSSDVFLIWKLSLWLECMPQQIQESIRDRLWIQDLKT
jgi:hypothetical protein